MGDSDDKAYEHYLALFTKRFGDRSEGAFIKHGKVMIQKLSRTQFAERYSNYVELRREVEKILRGGSTISDAVVMDFQDASSWIALDPPNILDMFKGELGDPGWSTELAEIPTEPARKKPA